MNNDTIRPGVTIGIPGSGQRIDDLRKFYERDNAVQISPFDPTVARSYATERITSNRLTILYNHLRQPIHMEG